MHSESVCVEHHRDYCCFDFRTTVTQKSSVQSASINRSCIKQLWTGGDSIFGVHKQELVAEGGTRRASRLSAPTLPADLVSSYEEPSSLPDSGLVVLNSLENLDHAGNA